MNMIGESKPESQASTSFHANSAADATMLPHLSTDETPGIGDSVQNRGNSAREVSIELKQYENPKEITCKGGLMIDEEIEIEDIKSVLLGDTTNRLIENQPLEYKDISEELIESVLKEYRFFIDQFFGLHTRLNFSKEFGVNPATISIAQEALTAKAKEYLLLGIEQRVKELNDDESVAITESLFFYPLIGGLNALAFAVNGAE